MKHRLKAQILHFIVVTVARQHNKYVLDNPARGKSYDFKKSWGISTYEPRKEVCGLFSYGSANITPCHTIEPLSDAVFCLRTDLYCLWLL
jgi:hypothetical protein